MLVETTACQRWLVFWDTVYNRFPVIVLTNKTTNKQTNRQKTNKHRLSKTTLFPPSRCSEVKKKTDGGWRNGTQAWRIGLMLNDSTYKPCWDGWWRRCYAACCRLPARQCRQSSYSTHSVTAHHSSSCNDPSERQKFWSWYTAVIFR